MESHHDYHIASEPDVSGKMNRHIWYYFLVFGVLLFATIGGLTIMYRFQLDFEKERKIGIVNTKESIDAKAEAATYLSGKRGLFEGKRHIPIDDAIAKFLSDARKAQ